MYFYNIEETMIVKYKVNLNVTRLRNIKKQIIKKCSNPIFNSYETTNPPIQFDYPNITNYKLVKSDDKKFQVSYDLYNVPYLVTLIKKLLLGNTNVISEIQNYQEFPSMEDPYVNEKYQILLSKLYDKEDIKIYGAEENKQKRIVLLKELENLLSTYENKRLNNIKHDMVDRYRIKTLECIDLKFIKSISLKDFIELQCFFYNSDDKEMCEDLQKILKKGN